MGGSTAPKATVLGKPWAGAFWADGWILRDPLTILPFQSAELASIVEELDAVRLLEVMCL